MERDTSSMKATKRKRRARVHCKMVCKDCGKELKLGMSYYVAGACYEWCEECYGKIQKDQ